MALIKVWVSTNRIGSKDETEIEVDDEDLEGLTEEEAERVIDEVAREAMFEMIDWSWERADA